MGNIGVDAAKLAGLQVDLLQKVRLGQITLEHIEAFNMLTKAERDKYLASSKFFCLDTFVLTVPEGYKHETQLSTLKRKEFSYFNDAVTDANFVGATSKLVPGKTYTVKIFGIRRTVSSEECLDLYRKQQALLTGAQGIALAYQQARKEFPVGKWLASFDEEQALWEDADGCRRVPCVYRFTDGDFEFYLGYFALDCFDGYCLLLFCDESA